MATRIRHHPSLRHFDVQTLCHYAYMRLTTNPTVLSQPFFRLVAIIFQRQLSAIDRTSLILDAIVKENSKAIFLLFGRSFSFEKRNYVTHPFSRKTPLLLINSPDDIFGRKLRWHARDRGSSLERACPGGMTAPAKPATRRLERLRPDAPIVYKDAIAPTACGPRARHPAPDDNELQAGSPAY